MNKEKKEKKPKYYYDWLEARCIYTNTGCLSQKELGGLEDPKNVNKPMKKKEKKINKKIVEKFVKKKSNKLAKELDEVVMRYFIAPKWIARWKWLYKIYAKIKRF